MSSETYFDAIEILNLETNVSSPVYDPAERECWIDALDLSDPRRGDRVEVWEIADELVQQGWVTAPGAGTPEPRRVRRRDTSRPTGREGDPR